ncbi:MAG: hypothetical protein KDE47_14330, partial [Caldilineaceae bacterium]|nr:hypothetical protein [Caldilineaceae bacterium]
TAVDCIELADELAQGLDFLVTTQHDAATAQPTLRAVFERSWHLLRADEQVLLTQLAVFPGTFHRTAAQTIAGATIELLTHLINHSLLNHSGNQRYTMHRSIQDFALTKLAAPPDRLNSVRSHFIRFYLDLLARQEQALHTTEHATAIAQIYLELDNLRTAWRWAIQARMSTLLNRALHAFFLFYESQGLYVEALDLFGQAQQQFADREETERDRELPQDNAQEDAAQEDDAPKLQLLLGRLHCYVGIFSARLGRMAYAEETLRCSLSLLRQENDASATTFCLSVLGSLLRITDPQQSKAFLTEAVQLAPTSSDRSLESLVLLLLGDTHFFGGDYAIAGTLYRQGYELAYHGAWEWGLTVLTGSLGRLKLAHGDYRGAEELLRQSLAYAEERKQRDAHVEAKIFLGEALRLQGHYAEASACFVEGYHAAVALQFKLQISHALWAQGALAEQCGEWVEAKLRFEECLESVHPNLWGQVLPTYGWALIGLGELAAAQRYFTEIFTEAKRHQRLPIALDAQVGLVVSDALAAQTVNTLNADSSAEITQRLQAIAANPAATQETRDRINGLARFGLQLPHPKE